MIESLIYFVFLISPSPRWNMTYVVLNILFVGIKFTHI